MSEEELYALDLFARCKDESLLLSISPPSEAVLQRLLDMPRYKGVVQLFLGRVDVLAPTRYFKRWSRRLRKFGFAPEDAAILALGPFSVGKDRRQLGVHSIATFDRSMIRQWQQQ